MRVRLKSATSVDSTTFTSFFVKPARRPAPTAWGYRPPSTAGWRTRLKQGLRRCLERFAFGRFPRCQEASAGVVRLRRAARWVELMYVKRSTNSSRRTLRIHIHSWMITMLAGAHGEPCTSCMTSANPLHSSMSAVRT